MDDFYFFKQYVFKPIDQGSIQLHLPRCYWCYTKKKILGHELVIPLTCVGCVGYNFAVDYVPQHLMPLLKYTVAKIEKDWGCDRLGEALNPFPIPTLCVCVCHCVFIYCVFLPQL